MGGIAGGARRSVLEFDVGVGFRGLPVAKLNNGQGLENGASQPLGPALSRPPAKSIARTVSLGVPVGADGARGDNYQEEQRDQPGDAVQDAHSNGRITPGLLAVLVLVHAREVAGDGGPRGPPSARGKVLELRSRAPVRHGQDLLVVEILAGQPAALSQLAVEHNGRGLRSTAHQIVEDLVGLNKRVVHLVTAQIRDHIRAANAAVVGRIDKGQLAIDVDLLVDG